MNRQGVIFLDIDGTLLNLQQQPTTETIFDEIRELQALGYHFGLNSNRSLEDIEPIVDLFCLDGPFILENGAYMKEHSGHERVFFSEDIDIPEITLAAMKEFSYQDVAITSIKLTDTTSQLYSGNTDTNIGFYVYMNKYRKYSASIHHRINGESSFQTAQNISEHLNSYFKDTYSSLIAIPHSHGNTVTVEVHGVTKGTALEHYKTLHPAMTIYAIGDGLNDASLKGYVDHLFAVGNAVDELTSCADYVSPLSITEGVVDILNYIKNLKQ